MREDLGQRGQAATGRLLRSNAAAVTAEWALECGGDPPVPDPGGLLVALADAIADASAPEGPPVPSLHALAQSLVDDGPGLDVVVRHLGALREVLHRLLVAELPAARALDAQHELNVAIDTIIEMCTSGATTDLERAAFVDPLTGLLNRRALDRDLCRELALAARHGHCVSMVVGDLDGLKAINDHFGHAAGDEALCSLAAAVRSGVRAGDTAYRVGGDEFVMVLPMSPSADVPGVVSRVVAAGAPAFGWGQATFPDDGADAAALLDLADHRLFATRRETRRHGPAAASPPLAPVPTVRGRRRHPVLASSLLVVALSGGAGLASAATGQLPGSAQRWAHAVLAKVGVSVPDASTADDRRENSRTSLRREAGHGGLPGEPAEAPVVAETSDAGGAALGVAPEPPLVPPVLAGTVAPPQAAGAILAGTAPSPAPAPALKPAPMPVLTAQDEASLPPEPSGTAQPKPPEAPAAELSDTTVPSEPTRDAPPALAEPPEPYAPVPGDHDPVTPPGVEPPAAPAGEVGAPDKPRTPRNRFLHHWLPRSVGDGKGD